MRICTSNPGKVSEFGGLLAPLDINLDVSGDYDIPETGITFADNSREKILGYAKHYSGEWLLADDSGLVIPALNNLPGPFSARFSDLDLDTLMIVSSGDDREVIDLKNNNRVLELLSNIPHDNRGAYFVACITVLNPDGKVSFQVERRAYGYISKELRGKNGFGYDPLFISDNSFGKTWAEIDKARKSLISHRSKAIWDFLAWICSTSEVIS